MGKMLESGGRRTGRGRREEGGRKGVRDGEGGGN